MPISERGLGGTVPLVLKGMRMKPGSLGTELPPKGTEATHQVQSNRNRGPEARLYNIGPAETWGPGVTSLCRAVLSLQEFSSMSGLCQRSPDGGKHCPG